MKAQLLATSTDMLCAVFLEKDMDQAYHEETDHLTFLQGGVHLEEKLTPVDMISGLV